MVCRCPAPRAVHVTRFAFRRSPLARRHAPRDRRRAPRAAILTSRAIRRPTAAPHPHHAVAPPRRPGRRVGAGWAWCLVLRCGNARRVACTTVRATHTQVTGLRPDCARLRDAPRAMRHAPCTIHHERFPTRHAPRDMRHASRVVKRHAPRATLPRRAPRHTPHTERHTMPRSTWWMRQDNLDQRELCSLSGDSRSYIECLESARFTIAHRVPCQKNNH